MLPPQDEDPDVANERRRVLRGSGKRDLLRLENLTKVTFIVAQLLKMLNSFYQIYNFYPLPSPQYNTLFLTFLFRYT